MRNKVLLAMTPAELTGYLAELGEPGYRARQIMDWLYNKEALSFAQMTNLPQGLRDRLASETQTGFLREVTSQISSDGTIKLLFALTDGQSVETVALAYGQGHSVCVSTQVGCRMGCRFCASGQPGFIRNLSADEIMAQVLQVKKMLAGNGQTLGSMVLMGSGEPLDNWAETIRFLQAVNDPDRLGMSLRHVTLSTSGLVPRIRELAGLGWPLTLSVSLHAPNDRLRNEIMPINKKYPLAELLLACREYASATGRRVTFDYTLIEGLNDSETQARELARLLRGELAHVNLIPFNRVPELGLSPSGEEVVQKFRKILHTNRINVTVRRRLGFDIAAACGQLRNIYQGSEPDECRRNKRQGKNQGKK